MLLNTTWQILANNEQFLEVDEISGEVPGPGGR